MKKLNFVFLMLLVAIFYYFFQSQIYTFIQSNPWISGVVNEISGRTLLGLFYITSFASLFFAFIPSEAITLFYFTLDYNPIFIILIATFGNIAGMTFNYLFGLIFGKFALKDSKIQKWLRIFDKYGSFVILIGNIIPFPIEPLSVGIGAIGYSFRKYIKYTALGRLIKFVILFLLYEYFSENILPIISVYIGGI